MSLIMQMVKCPKCGKRYPFNPSVGKMTCPHCLGTGLDMTTFFTMSAKQAVREQAIPFMVTMDVPNVETRQAMRDTLEGKGLSRGYSSFKEMMEDI